MNHQSCFIAHMAPKPQAAAKKQPGLISGSKKSVKELPGVDLGMEDSDTFDDSAFEKY